MIKINLLPVRKAKKKSTQQRKLTTLALGYLLLCGALFGVYRFVQLGVEKVERQNSQLRIEIESVKKEGGDIDKIKGQIKEMQEQELVVNQLVAGRTGPVLMLRELAWILTSGKGPSYDKKAYDQLIAKDPNAGFN